MTSGADKKLVRARCSPLTGLQKFGILESFRRLGSSQSSSQSSSQRSSGSCSPSPEQIAFERRQGLRPPAHSPRRKGRRRCYRPRIFQQSGSPQGRSLSSRDYHHALFASLSPGGWRSGEGTPVSDSLPGCWECQKLEKENKRLTEENERLTEDVARLTRRILVDSLFEE